MPGSAGGGGGRRVSGGMGRMTYFDWFEVKVGPLRAVTPEEGADKGPVTPEQHVRIALGISDAVLAGDTRPTLVYFHWPHEDPACGKVSDTLCDQVLNDETVARWGMLFRCVQVDMAESDERLVKLLEAGSKPSFVAVDKDAKVIARIPALGSATKMQKALQAAIQKFPDEWKRIQAEIAKQETWMAEAKVLLKQDKDVEALKLIDKVRYSSIRIGPLFDKSQNDGMEVGQRVERASVKK